MRVNKQIGSKERFLEIFQGVNKVKLNENLMEMGGANLNPENVLNMSFNELKNNRLNVEHSNTQASGEESYVELMCTDKQGNNITFTFKTISQEGDQEGVFNVDNVSLFTFSFDSAEGDETVEIAEDGLKRFNQQHANEMFNVVEKYLDVEPQGIASAETSSSEELEEAIKLIDAIKKDSSPYGGGFDKMQTGKAYADEKPTNTKVRVKSAELDKFVQEDFEQPKIAAMGVGGVVEAEEKSNYPEQMGKEFQPKKKYPVHKKKHSKKVKLAESTDRDKYEDVVFLQGDEAFEPLERLDREGPEAALEYLKQWHYPGEHQGSQDLKHGADDKTFEKDGYTMTWNPRLDYIGLQYDMAKLQEGVLDNSKSYLENKELQAFYDANQDKIHEDWDEYIGRLRDSSEHKSYLQNCDECFWEWVDENYWDEASQSYAYNYPAKVMDEDEYGDDDISNLPPAPTGWGAKKYAKKDMASSFTQPGVTDPRDEPSDKWAKHPLPFGTKMEFAEGEEKPETDDEEGTVEPPKEYVEPNMDMFANGIPDKIKNEPEDGMSLEPENDVIAQLAQDKEETGEILKGGKGDGKSPVEFNGDQIMKGMEVEKEHTDDPMAAIEIVLDHLTEDPEYYTQKETPEASAQFGASKDAPKDDDMEDVLLGFKPHNVGDEIEDDEEEEEIEPEKPETEEEPEEELPKKEDELGENIKEDLGFASADKGNQLQMDYSTLSDEQLEKLLNLADKAGVGYMKQAVAVELGKRQLQKAKQQSAPMNEQQIRTAKRTLSNSNVPTGMSKKEAVQILVKHLIK